MDMNQKSDGEIIRAHHARIGAKGGRKTKELYGPSHFSTIAKNGWRGRKKKETKSGDNKTGH